MKLHYHPVSSYSQKTLMAFHETEVPFTPAFVDVFSPEARAAYQGLHPLANPLGKIPLLEVEHGWAVPESSIIIEYIDTHHNRGHRLLPADQDLARRVRLHDRQFDLYVNDPMATIFFDGRRPEAERSPHEVARAKQTLDVMYEYFDKHFAKRTWVLGDEFTMADCSAAPALGYLRMVYPYDRYPNLVSYFGRVAERPSYMKVIAEAQPYFARFAR